MSNKITVFSNNVYGKLSLLIFTFLKSYKTMVCFLFEFLDSAFEWHILHFPGGAWLPNLSNEYFERIKEIHDS